MPRFTLPACALTLALALGAAAGCAAPDDVTVLAAPSPLAAQPPSAAALPPALTEDRTVPGTGTLGEWRHRTPSISTPRQFRRVRDADGLLVVGDSIAQATAYELAVRAGAAYGLPVAVNAHPGRPTEPAADWIDENAALIPDRGIVVVSGANDVFAPLGWWRQVERVLAAADGRPVYWLTVHVDRWSGDAVQRAADRSHSDWLNDQLRALAQRHPNLVVVDWAGAVTGDLLSDGVHPSDAGVAAWCDLLERALGLAS
ncbi:GDSL-type esterase/lipase family protein [Jiangella endophytica]|uniref:GDSL-type esterase/lipase family protein n=1 Tax=Jiangella endophytica TaxID=1623398 RepID=UPI000E34DFD1|nr:GDSL-type esterase/lipase family protein [Jiangella endophytica]